MHPRTPTTIGDAGEKPEIEKPGQPAILPDELHARATQLEELLEVIAAEVAKDGGEVRLLDADYANGVVKLSLGGACGSCSLTGATLDEGIRRILTQRLDWVTEIHGDVEENNDVIGRGGWRARRPETREDRDPDQL